MWWFLRLPAATSAPAFAGHTGTAQYVSQFSAASVSILRLKYDSKGSGTCQTDENDKGAGLGVGGRTSDDGQSLTVTWIVYAPPTSNTRLSTV